MKELYNKLKNNNLNEFKEQTVKYNTMNSSRIYLPKKWEGKKVITILLD